MVAPRLRRLVRRFVFNEHGAITTEFALMAPMMMLLALATVDTINYINVANRVTQVSAHTADAVARRKAISDGDEINDFFLAANEIGDPLPLEAAGRVIISSVANVDGTGPRIVWQRTGDYDLAVVSSLGVEGDLANVPNDFELALDENAIFAEVFYEHRPLVYSANLLSGPETVILERMTTFRPRLAPLLTLN